jgi:hypothetical protein
MGMSNTLQLVCFAAFQELQGEGSATKHGCCLYEQLRHGMEHTLAKVLAALQALK